MNRRKILSRAAKLSPIAILPGCATVADLALRSQYLIRTDQIMRQLLPYFPFQRKAANVGQLSLANPIFSMAPEKNKVRIGLTTGVAAASGLAEMTGIPALGQLAGRSTAGTCLLACGLRYDRETRGIYLKRPEIERLDFQSLSSTLSEPFRQVINLFGPQLLDRQPVHTLEPSLATRFLNSMVVQQNGIALKFAP